MKQSTYDSLPIYSEDPSWDYSQNPADFTFGDYRWICTCGSYPEQYDIFYKDKYVAYGRLRNGIFSVTKTASLYWPFYLVNWRDAYNGCFNSHVEREFHVNNAQKEIETYYNNKE